MSFYQPAQSSPQRFRLVLSSFMQHGDLPFAKVLPEETIKQAFAEEECAFAQDEEDVYTPAVTLWAFLSQVLFKGEQRSCLAAVARVVVLCVTLGRGAWAKKGGEERGRESLRRLVLIPPDPICSGPNRTASPGTQHLLQRLLRRRQVALDEVVLG